MKRYSIYIAFLAICFFLQVGAIAADTYYPAESADRWSTLAFEDNWPLEGDYDMNDLVLQYRVHTYGVNADTVSKIDVTLRIQARGAGYSSGFGIQWDNLVKENVLSSTMSTNGGTANTWPPKADQESLVFTFFNSATMLAPRNSGCDYFNTEPAAALPPLVPQPASTTFVLSFTLDQEYSIQYVLQFPPYNPFIFRSNERVREVHLANKVPTSWALANNIAGLFFGQGDDNSSVEAGRYYKTRQGMPWALNFSEKWNHPVEVRLITDAYPFFASWVTTNKPLDWYMHPATFPPGLYFPFQTINYTH